MTQVQKRNKKLFNTIIADAPLSSVQIDLMNVSKWQALNRKVKYIFTIIDVHSRYLSMFGLTNKKADTTTKMFKQWMQKNGTPKNVNTDDGSEFKASFKKLLNEKNITHHISVGTDEHHNKQAIVERVHRTIRDMIGRYMQLHSTKKYRGVSPIRLLTYKVFW